LIGLAIVGLCAAWVATALASDQGQAAADLVSQSNYQTLMNTYLYTHNGNNRAWNGANHNQARDNIRTLFQSYGLTAVLEPFTYGGYSGNNVVATKLGTVDPNRIYIVGGHYDSAGTPGADDNASGVALTLEAARVLSAYPSDYTIRFIAFDLEELGLYGSTAYVAAHPSDNIQGMISADMVAYDPNTNHALIYGRTASNPIKQAVAAAVNEYGPLTYTIGGQVDQSDHAPFEAAGKQACLLIEGEVWDNPYYHTQQDSYDTPGYVNFAYATKMTRSIVGWLTDTAVVHVPVNTLDFTYPDGLPAYSFPDGSTRVRVQVTGVGNVVPLSGTGVLHYNTGSSWQTTAMDPVAANLYDVQLPAATCGSQISYYFSAQAVGGQTYNDPRQAPTMVYQAAAAYGLNVAYENLLNSSPGWTVEGTWAFGHPTGGSGSHGGPDPTNGYTGTNVYGYNLSGGYTNSMPERNLTSTTINCTGLVGIKLSFYRWLGVEQSTWDHAYVRISNNGGSTWNTIWQNPDTTIDDGAWVRQEFDISAYANNQANVKLRWTLGTTDTAWTYCGWNIDDVRLTTLVCTAPYTPGDLNCDGIIDFDDINPFVLAISGQATYEYLYPNCYWMNGDVNGDGDVNFDDINPFVALMQN
jgi:hypothetical protein